MFIVSTTAVFHLLN